MATKTTKLKPDQIIWSLLKEHSEISLEDLIKLAKKDPNIASKKRPENSVKATIKFLEYLGLVKTVTTVKVVS